MCTLHLLTLLAMVLGLLLPAGAGLAAAGDRPPAAGMGALAGEATLGPVSPLQHPDIKPPKMPAPGVKIMVFGPGHEEITSVVTDAAGRFRVELPPGTYLIDLAPQKGKVFTKDLPATVIITAGRETRLDIHLDTGMR